MTVRTVRVPWKPLEEFTYQVFRRVGMEEGNARLMADTLTQANLRGVDSHGVDLLPRYYRLLRKGAVNPNPRIRVLKETPAALLLDGDNGPGQVVSTYGMREAVRKARGAGVGWVSVRNSNHQGALAYFALLAVQEGMIGLVTTNAPPVMAPWGGRRRLLGNNPLAIAVPAGRRRPLVLDMAMSVVANGKIRLARERGEPIPPGWALDKDGVPTTDPRAVEEGSCLPFGTYKGYGLALMWEVLAGVLSGALITTSVAGAGDYRERGWGIGHLLVAVDIATFSDPQEFRRKVDGLIEEMTSCPRAPGVERVYVPGEPEWERVPEREERGIPLHPSLLRDLRAIAEETGVPFPPCTPEEEGSAGL